MVCDFEGYFCRAFLLRGGGEGVTGEVGRCDFGAREVEERAGGEVSIAWGWGKGLKGGSPGRLGRG